MIFEKIIQVFTKFSLQADKFYIHLRSIPLVVGFAEFLQHIFRSFILTFQLDSFQNYFSHSNMPNHHNSKAIRKIPCRTRRVYSYCYSRHFGWYITSPVYVFSLYYRFSAQIWHKQIVLTKCYFSLIRADFFYFFRSEKIPSNRSIFII